VYPSVIEAAVLGVANLWIAPRLAATRAETAAVEAFAWVTVGAGTPAADKSAMTEDRSAPYDAVICTPGNVAVIRWFTASSAALAVVAVDEGWTSTAPRTAPPLRAAHDWSPDGLPK
jgi:hypothetical protein